MGTNFYWIGEKLGIKAESISDPTLHIGKRSAAGLYCWDCNLTLCKDGNDGVHKAPSNGVHHTFLGLNSSGKWYDECPGCGKTPNIKGMPKPMAVELGFAKPEIKRPTGVCGCFSFTYAQDRKKVRSVCESHLDDKIIVDEYDREFTGAEFLTMLEMNCPITFDMIDKWFS
jgi:hypothetical protein